MPLVFKNLFLSLSPITNALHMLRETWYTDTDIQKSKLKTPLRGAPWGRLPSLWNCSPDFSFMLFLFSKEVRLH